ncbi:MAG: hypothetical protein NC410_04080 [Oscillibacter sp.]|nr:hypothetical protein [Oscillibacter sp.]
MTVYEIVAFYRESEEEVREHAERFAAFCGFGVRYEKYPAGEKGMTDFIREDTVVCVFNRHAMKFRKFFRFVYAVQRPALVFGTGCSPEAYHRLKLPVGYDLENKEKAVWANFFRRRNARLDVELLVPREKDELIAEKVDNNVYFTEKIFTDSGAVFQKSEWKLPYEKLLESILRREENSWVLMRLPSRVFPFFIPFSLRVYRRYAHVPVLFIPRDESLYIPCH